MPNNFANL